MDLMPTNQKSPILEIPSDYASLCQNFLPRPIRSHSAYQATLLVINLLKDRPKKLTRDQQDYLNLLELLIQRYEGLAIPNTTPKPLSLLKQLVDEHRLTKSDLSKILGRSLALASMILSGQRKITREHAVRLGKYFGIAPEPFLA